MSAEYLKTREAVEEARVSPRTLERWIASGMLPVVRIGGVRRIRRGDLESLLAPN